MANTYHQMYVMTVFAVKYRDAVIEKEWRTELMAVIGNLINETGCKTIIVNGPDDHVHCLFGLKPTLAVPDVMRSTKAKSSKWVNESGMVKTRFEWQEGFGCFTYSHSQINTVYKYIFHQEEHHKKESFKTEYIGILRKFAVDFDENYIFKDLI
ncbi:MAG TPA: IS200/IS605 family transposase [Prolixibacteraceae bacterium]|nr:IS200/IS605 family transposase [Prolixibacteraceae bacterium]